LRDLGIRALIETDTLGYQDDSTANTPRPFRRRACSVRGRDQDSIPRAAPLRRSAGAT